LRSKAEPAFEYLALLSAKYDVDPDKLFHAVSMAEEHNKSECGDLEIRCRGKTKDKAVFLILKDSKVVAQFPIFKESLLNQHHQVTNAFLARKARKARKVAIQSIKDLKSGMTQVCLKAKVLEIPKPNQVITHYGNYANVTNALIGDGTGTIHLCLWNEMINCVSTGDTIRIENARTAMFKGQIQLKVRRKGLFSSTSAALMSEVQPVSSP
jgi:hypothetical protein